MSYCCVAHTQLVLCRAYATGSRPTAITMTRDKPNYKVCDCICNRAFFVLYERSLQNNTAVGDKDGPSPTTTTPSTSATNLPRTSWGTTRPMGKLVCSVGQLFYIDQFGASTERPAQRPSKKCLFDHLTRSEGVRILMEHPVAATAATADHETFIKKVRQLFERPVNPVHTDFEFRSRRQGACESVGELLTALRMLYTDCTPPTVERAAAGAARAIEEHSIAMPLAIGCYNRSTQEKLLQETEVNLTNFQRIMEADETAAASSAALRRAQPLASIAMTSSHDKGPKPSDVPSSSITHLQVTAPRTSLPPAAVAEVMHTRAPTALHLANSVRVAVLQIIS